MGLKRFFKKVGGWVKDKFHKVKNVVTKFAKPVVSVVKKAVDFVGKTPLAPIINTATGGAFNIVKKVADFIPDGAVKDNVNKFTNRAEQIRDRVVDKVDTAQNRFNTAVDRGRQIGGVIRQNIPSVKPIMP